MTDMYLIITNEILRRQSITDNLDELIELIKKIPVEDSLFLLSRIDTFLILQKNSRDLQIELVDYFFENETAECIKKHMKSNPTQVVFGAQTIYFLMGKIIKYGNYKMKGRLNIEVFVHVLGNLILEMNKYITISINDEDEVLDDSKRKCLLVWQSGQFYDSIRVEISCDLARTYCAYKSKNYKQFLSVFKKITGINLDFYWNIIFFIYSQLPRFEGKFDFNRPTIDLSSIRKLNVNIEEIEQIFKILSINIEDIKEGYETSISHYGNEWFNFEFIREKPLLKIADDKYVLLSYPYLINMTTSGLMKYVKEKVGDTEYQKIQSFFGDFYEFYLNTMTSKAYSDNVYSNIAGRFFREKDQGIEISDGVIDYGDRAIFIEVKSAVIMQKSFSNNYRDFKKVMSKFLTKKGAVQLNDRINQFRKGIIKIKGMDAKSIKYYYPILVTCVDHLPQYNHLSNEYYKIIEGEHILQEYGVKRLTIVTIEEYELLMGLVEKGHNLTKIIDKRNNDIELRYSSMKNYLLKHFELSMPEHLKKTMVEISNHTIEVFGTKSI